MRTQLLYVNWMRPDPLSTTLALAFCVAIGFAVSWRAQRDDARADLEELRGLPVCKDPGCAWLAVQLEDVLTRSIEALDGLDECAREALAKIRGGGG